MKISIYTIGFTKKSAKEFFEILEKNKIKQVVDIRLNNTSQLAGFAKKNDLEYFLNEISNIDYFHFEFLAPTKELRDIYPKGNDWDLYVKKFRELLDERKILNKLDKSFFEKKTCLLCAESTPENCHRRLLAEYLKEHWNDAKIIHL